jgi:AraC-like DNA-binding protein
MRTAGQAGRAVGYQPISAFVTGFRREAGLTPGGYFRGPPLPGPAGLPTWHRRRLAGSDRSAGKTVNTPPRSGLTARKCL